MSDYRELPRRESRRPRSNAVVVFGVLNMIASCLVFACNGGANLCCLGFLKLIDVQQQGFNADDLIARLDIPGIGLYLTASVVAWAVLGVVAFVSGIGLLMARSWAREASLVWAGATIVISFASVIYVIGIYNPGWNSWLQEEHKQHPQQNGGPPPNYPLVVTVPACVFSISYAVLLGAFMLMKSVREACQPKERPIRRGPRERNFFEEGDL